MLVFPVRYQTIPNIQFTPTVHVGDCNQWCVWLRPALSLSVCHPYLARRLQGARRRRLKSTVVVLLRTVDPDPVGTTGRGRGRGR